MLAQFKVGASLRKLKLLDSFNREVLFNCNCIKKSLKKIKNVTRMWNRANDAASAKMEKWKKKKK